MHVYAIGTNVGALDDALQGLSAEIVLDYILKAHHQQRHLSVFKMSIRRYELAETFKLLESMETGDDLS